MSTFLESVFMYHHIEDKAYTTEFRTPTYQKSLEAETRGSLYSSIIPKSFDLRFAALFVSFIDHRHNTNTNPFAITTMVMTFDFSYMPFNVAVDIDVFLRILT